MASFNMILRILMQGVGIRCSKVERRISFVPAIAGTKVALMILLRRWWIRSRALPGFICFAIVMVVVLAWTVEPVNSRTDTYSCLVVMRHGWLRGGKWGEIEAGARPLYWWEGISGES